MKTIRMIIAGLVAAASLTSCVFIGTGGGKTVNCKGPVQEKSLDLKDFDRIVVNGHADIVVSQQESFSVQVRANEEVFDYLDYHVENGSLILETKDHVNLRAETFDVTVTLPILKDISFQGAGDLDLKGGYYADEPLAMTVNGAGDMELRDIQVPSLSITINGAGDIEAKDIDVDELAVSVNGAGDVEVSGKAGKASFSVAGAGDIDALGLDVQDVETHKTGIASIKLKNR